MKWEKKICIRITMRRLMGAILVTSIIANLIIVGVVFGSDSFESSDTATPVSGIPAERQEISSLVTASMTSEIFTTTPTPSPTVTLTSTDTPTELPTDLPTLAICVLQSSWPVYQVQLGDTLTSVSRITGSTVKELMLANCLTVEMITVGQRLYVPRLPVRISAPLASATAREVFTDTPNSTPTNTPYVTTITPTITQRVPVTDTVTTEPIYFQQAE